MGFKYGYKGRLASPTLASVDDTVGHRFSSVLLSELLSTPNGTFSVFVTSGHATPVVMKIVAALDDDAALLEPHPDFRDEFVGSFTLWPYKPVA